jgi:DNA invertase Pin-like site-specific DNA recombinase
MRSLIGPAEKSAFGPTPTDSQDTASQVDQLRSAGCDKLFSENVSGVVTDRRQLAKAIASLTSGDVLVVTKLDRLARSTRDLLNTIAMITEKNAGFKVLGNPAMDTTSAHGRLLLNILGSIAEFERELIRSRTGEGRARAMAIKFGRKPALTEFQRSEALKRRENGETCVDIARSLNVSHSTIGRL